MRKEERARVKWLELHSSTHTQPHQQANGPNTMRLQQQQQQQATYQPQQPQQQSYQQTGYGPRVRHPMHLVLRCWLVVACAWVSLCAPSAASASQFVLTGTSELDLVQVDYDYGDSVVLGNYSVQVVPPGGVSPYQVAAHAVAGPSAGELVLRGNWIFQSTPTDTTGDSTSLSAAFNIQDTRVNATQQTFARNATVVCQACTQPLVSCGASCTYTSSFSTGEQYTCEITTANSGQPGVYTGFANDPTGRQVLSVSFSVGSALEFLSLTEVFNQLQLETSMVMPPATTGTGVSQQGFVSALEWCGSSQFFFRLAENATDDGGGHLTAILVGSIAGGLVLIGIAVCCWMSRRRKQREHELNPNDHLPYASMEDGQRGR